MTTTTVTLVPTCDTCDNGCDCDITKDLGCGHYGCWGSQPTYDCDGVPAQRAITEAALAGARR